MKLGALLLRTMMILFLIVVCAAAFPDAKAQSPIGSGLREIEKRDAESMLPERTWQLVEIVSMDDKIEIPEKPSLYTLKFKEDGTVQIESDCNSGTVSWSSSAPGHLQFGPIAAIQAQCLPESLHDSYIGQFPWVRSYVLKGGRLFLATKADGSIIEFEPVEPPLAATVLGEAVRTDNADEMQEIILSKLFDRYAKEQNIEVTEKEIDAFVKNTREGMKAIGLTGENELTVQEKVQLEKMRRNMGLSIIRHWKTNRALYRQYGGRIIYQQLGPEPLDAYRQYLRERQESGDFIIHQKAFEDAFWRYFTTDSLHSFYEPGRQDEASAFSIALWERSPGGTKKIRQLSPAGEVPAAAEEGGPLNWQVSGITGQLNLRAEPSTSSGILDTYSPGTILTNLGCKLVDGRMWCDVQKFTGGPRGYAAAEFLEATVSPDGTVIKGPENSALRAGQGKFDASGKIPCAQVLGQPMTLCDFGVSRTGGGYATVVITKPDGLKRAIFFQLGVAIGADTSQADGYPEIKATKEGDLHLIRLGHERYEIPDAVLFGG